jgi:hypothetical protein
MYGAHRVLVGKGSGKWIKLGKGKVQIFCCCIFVLAQLDCSEHISINLVKHISINLVMFGFTNREKEIPNYNDI